VRGGCSGTACYSSSALRSPLSSRMTEFAQEQQEQHFEEEQQDEWATV
jgi:hypothetical protein